MKAVVQLTFSATGIVIIMIPLSVVVLLTVGRIEWIAIALAAFAFAILSGYNAILNGIQNAARQRSIVALHQGMDTWLRFLVAAGLMFWLGATSTMAMIGYAVAVIVVLGSQSVFFRRLLPEQLVEAGNEPAWRKQMWRYSWPMAVTGIMSWGVFASQRWALELFTSTEDVGYFSAVFQIGFTPVSLAGGIVMTLMMPIFFNRAGDGVDRRKTVSVYRSIMGLCLLAVLVVFLVTAMGALFHEGVFHLLVAEQYREVSGYLPFVILAAGIFQVSLFLSMIILVSTDTRVLLPLNTVGNTLFILLNLFFTYRYGMGGLVFAMVIGSAVHLVWIMSTVYKVLKHE